MNAPIDPWKIHRTRLIKIYGYALKTLLYKKGWDVVPSWYDAVLQDIYQNGFEVIKVEQKDQAPLLDGEG